MIKIIKKICFSLIIAGIVFLAAEGILRLYSPKSNHVPISLFSKAFEMYESGPFRDVDWTPYFSWKGTMDQLSLYEEDRSLGFRMKKNHEQYSYNSFTPYMFEKMTQYYVKLNSDGYRNNEYAVKKPDNSYRIVCLGDSSTFGINVENDATYPRVVENLLQLKYPHITFQVFNYGVPGYSSEQGKVLLENRIFQLQPDFISIAFGFNDWIFQKSTDRETFNTENARLRKVRSFLLKSELLKYIHYSLYKTKFIFQEKRAKNREKKLNQFNFIAYGMNRSNFQGFTPKVPLEQFRENIRSMNNNSRARNIDTVFLIPHVNCFELLSFPIGPIQPYYELLDMSKNGEINLVLLDELQESLAYVQKNTLLREKAEAIKKKLKPEFRHADIWLFKSDHVHPNEITNYLIALKLINKIENTSQFQHIIRNQ